LARLIKEKEIIHNNIHNFIEDTTKNYTEFFGKSPTFVTYFNKNTTFSTHDQGLESVDENLGIESPLRFNQITNLTIFNFPNVNPINTIDDGNLFSSWEGEAIVVPDTIIPFPDDYFYLMIDNEKRLFKVTETQFDKINGKKFYQIKFTLSEFKSDAIESQLEGKLTQKYDVKGTNTRILVDDEINLVIEYLEEIEDILKDKFITYFTYNNLDDLPLIPDVEYGINLIDFYLVRFISKHNLLNRNNKGMYNSITYRTYPYYKSKWFLVNYEKTIFKAFESSDLSSFLFKYTLEHFIDEPNSIFESDSKNYQRLEYSHIKPDGNLIPNPLNWLIELIDDDRTPNNIFEEVIKVFLTDELVISNTTLDAVNNLEIIPDRFFFYSIPMVLFILQEFKKDKIGIYNTK